MNIQTRKYLFLATVLLIFSNVATQAQENKGIHFENGLSWEQIKTKAKAENKYIFMDVFATWCGPCKAMDKNVYPSEQLGDYMNDKFISLKVQTDQTKEDKEEVKAWYQDAKHILVDYRINGYPSLLFFSPDGRLVHRGIGYSNIEALTKLASDARNPRKQYDTQLEQYKEGAREYENLPNLIRKTKSFGEKDMAQKMTDDYLCNYLYKLPEKKLFTKENLLFVAMEIGDSFTSDSRVFQFIYKNPIKADEIVGNNGFAESVIAWRITKEELYNKLWKKDDQPITLNPNWKMINAAIRTKYNSKYAGSLVLPAQLLFYRIEKNWNEYVHYTEIALKQYPPKKGGKRFGAAIGVSSMSVGTDDWALNEVAWTMFEGSTEKSQLEKALNWSKWSTQIVPAYSKELNQYLDTQANLLYKLGRVKEAIACEEQAIKDPFSSFFAKSYQETIEKMKNNIITWPDTAAKQ